MSDTLVSPLPLPTRDAGLSRLAAFAPRSGRAYAEGRNHALDHDQPSAVSALSAHVRHRLLTEEELVRATLEAHGPRAEKLVQEVCWRTYWKGWLELRPGVWDAYKARLGQDYDRLATEGGLRRIHADACAGRTGIACFDHWAREIAEIGWLHNHARMWFASIWVFTLRLPWTLGADFFLRHLCDADAASNTLSWRWVIGSQTRGKHYVARAENIARYTGGRFDPRGELNEAPEPIVEAPDPAPRPLPATTPAPAGPVALLLHADDLHAESLPLGAARPVALAGIDLAQHRSPRGCAAPAAAFAAGALADGLARAGAAFGLAPERLELADLPSWAARHGVPVVMPYAPAGWTADALTATGVALHPLRRDWDGKLWPHATKGFFAFRERLPDALRALGLPA